MATDIDQSETTAPGELRFKNIWRSIGYLIIIIIIILSLIQDLSEITPFSSSDKLMHALAYGFSMLWFSLCFRGRKLYIIGAGLILLGITLEIVQGQTGYRTMSLYDIVANSIGVLLGLMFAFSRLSKSLYYIEQKLINWRM